MRCGTETVGHNLARLDNYLLSLKSLKCDPAARPTISNEKILKIPPILP